MRYTLRDLLLLCSIGLNAGLTAQTLTDANTIPAIGTVETRSYYSDSNASGWVTTGSGNTWNATSVSPSGVYEMVSYLAPGASPHAATYPTATLCAQADGNGSPTEWRHWATSSSLSEMLGVNTDIFVGGRTACTYPLNLGGSFTDTYTIGSNNFTDVTDYVASGTVQAPWGTIPNVVMFQVNGGPFVLYRSTNMLNAIGSYFPGFGMDLWEVTLANGVNEVSTPSIGIWPVPATDEVRISLPLPGTCVLTILDAAGRNVREIRTSDPLVTLNVNELVPGVYTVMRMDQAGTFATGRLVVQ